MKTTLYVREDPAFLENAVFSGSPLYGMKSDMYMFIDLRRQLALHGVELSTQDILPTEQADTVLVLDQVMDFQDYRKQPGQQLHLILAEPRTYYPLNFQAEHHQVFDKVFTYDYTRVDNHKYFHYRFPIDFNAYPTFQGVLAEEFNRRKLCALVASAFGVVKPPAGSGSLLYERYKTLKWFSDCHPNELDFFSRGINPDAYTSFRGARLVQKYLPKWVIDRVAATRHRVFQRVHRGSIPPEQKIKKLREYRFSIAYENTGDTPGYITEKIFDCFAAAVVPVYLGAPHITDFIPADCFIDRRNFTSHEDLYQFLKTMSYADYSKYISAIERFLHGPERHKFSSATIADSIVQVMLADRPA